MFSDVMSSSFRLVDGNSAHFETAPSIKLNHIHILPTRLTPHSNFQLSWSVGFQKFIQQTEFGQVDISGREEVLHGSALAVHMFLFNSGGMNKARRYSLVSLFFFLLRRHSFRVERVGL